MLPNPRNIIKEEKMRHYNLCDEFAICLVLIFFSLLITSYDVFAKEYPSLHRGIRPLGMGGAFTAVADDENALFYNPAGLSNLPKFKMGLLNPLFEASKKSVDLISEVQDTNMNDTGEVTNFLRSRVGEHHHVRVSLFPHIGFNIAKTGVMIGALGQGVADAEVRNPVFPQANIDIIGDIGVLAGVGFKLPVTGLRVGASGKFISRRSLSEVFTAADIAGNFEDRINDALKSGSGFSLDLGVMYDLPFVKIVDTTVALALQNIPEMKMGDAVDIKTQLNAGVSIKKSFAGFTVIGALDYTDLSKNIGEDADTAKRLHLGAELKLPAILSVRAGLNQGYYTVGATINLKVLKLDAVTYGEEIGAYAGQKEDRRYIAQLTLGW